MLFKPSLYAKVSRINVRITYIYSDMKHILTELFSFYEVTEKTRKCIKITALLTNNTTFEFGSSENLFCIV